MRNKVQCVSILRSASIALALAVVLVLSFVATSWAQDQEYSFCVVYTFQGGTADGFHPNGRVVFDAKGHLYGTTFGGGSGSSGIVFEVKNQCKQTVDTVLHNFKPKQAPLDGLSPQAGLLLKAGVLYGTTQNGGDYSNEGTVFKVNTTPGPDDLLYSFSGGGDGSYPYAALVQDSAGNFYGTTTAGGSSNEAGVVFQLSKALQFTPLHIFGSIQGDGANPYARLALGAAGNLYGTTLNGGAYGDGTVFMVNKTGSGYKVLLSFRGSEYGEGSAPIGGVVLDSAGNIYGTTRDGGGGSGCCGEVFKLNSKGIEIAQFNFNSTNGQNPTGDLVLDSLGNVWGTTESGGEGSGIVFELDNKLQTLIFSRPFSYLSDGGSPYAGLTLDSAGNFYGSTTVGGSAFGYGTVFKLCPFPPGCQDPR